MTSFFFRKEKSTNSSKDTSGQYIEPEPDDIACLREVEVQRFKWNAFIKSRPNIWTEQWLWQHWQTASTKSVRPIKRIMQMFSSKLKAQNRLKKLIRAGIPPELRGSVWWACSGAADKMKAAGSQDQFRVLVERSVELNDSQIANDIEKDLLRTFPERILEDNSTIDSLRRVLLAYALRNTTVGYCQSMNYICALLLFHMSEEQAFWLLATLLEDLLPYNYYAPSLLGGRVDQQVFQSCIAWKLPRLHSQFKSTNTLLEPIICPWFLCLYINVLPLYTVCRVWDCLFWEGSVVLFRIGLTLMKSKSRQILDATDFVGIYSVLKSPSGGLKENSFVLETASVSSSPHSASSSAIIDTSGSVTSTSTAATDLANISDSQHLINSAFGYRWMRSVPKGKVDLLREKFHRLLDDSHEERHSAKHASKAGSAGVPTSPSTQANQKRTRKSTYMLRVLEENDISTLHDLAKELDEGLGSHVEEFARELHTESSDGGESRSPTKGDFECDEDDCDDEDEDLLEDDEAAEGEDDQESEERMS